MFALIPIGSDRAVFGLPHFTIGTIVVCTLVHFVSLAGFNMISAWGYVPSTGVSIDLLLSTLVHGGFFHLFGNMIFLWSMGVNLEARWGPVPFALLYVVGGVCASLSFFALHPTSDIPLVGASGAISACMGAFLVSFFKARVRIAWWVLRKAGVFTIPAYVILPFWFVGDLLGAYSEAHGVQGVAYSAHVGGFLVGAGIAAVVKLSGYEAKLMDERGSDMWDDPEQYNDAHEFDAPTVPWTCRVCTMQNEAHRPVCRRCRAKA